MICVSLSNRSEHKGRGLELVGLCVFCLWRILEIKSRKAAAPVDEEERLKQAPKFPGWVQGLLENVRKDRMGEKVD